MLGGVSFPMLLPFMPNSHIEDLMFSLEDPLLFRCFIDWWLCRGSFKRFEDLGCQHSPYIFVDHGDFRIFAMMLLIENRDSSNLPTNTQILLPLLYSLLLPIIWPFATVFSILSTEQHKSYHNRLHLFQKWCSEGRSNLLMGKYIFATVLSSEIVDSSNMKTPHTPFHLWILHDKNFHLSCLRHRWLLVDHVQEFATEPK